MDTRFEFRHLTATAIFALEDRFARDRGVKGAHPIPFGRVTFRLLRQEVGGVMTPITEPTVLVITKNESGYFLFFGEVSVTQADRRRVRQRLAPGNYVLRIESDFYQRHEMNVSVPNMTPIDVALEPGYAYPFPDAAPLVPPSPGNACLEPLGTHRRGPTLLRGSLHTADGRGIPGAVVRAGPPGTEPHYQTDETGNWLLAFGVGQPTGSTAIEVELPGFAPVSVPDVCVVRGRETSLRETALRGWVQRRGAGVRGATVQVPGHPGSTLTADGGTWFYYFGLNQPPETVAVTATLPSGEQLSASGVQVVPRGTTVVDTFRFP